MLSRFHGMWLISLLDKWLFGVRLLVDGLLKNGLKINGLLGAAGDFTSFRAAHFDDAVFFHDP